MTFREALSRAVKLLETNDIADAQLDAWYLLSYVSGYTRAQFFMVQQDTIDDDMLARYQQVLLKRTQHIPLQYIVGEQDFMGFTFWVNEHVLIPRQDTETLVEEALRAIPAGSHILDMCTGSGCILLSIISLGQDITGVGADISQGAVMVAQENRQRLDVAADIIQSDLFSNVTGKFNAIVSNPPYIPTEVIEGLAPEVRDFEPRQALDGTEDGLYFYRRITEESGQYLLDGGYLLYEIGHDQGQAVADIMCAAGFLDVEVIKDLAGNDRVVKGHL